MFEKTEVFTHILTDETHVLITRTPEGKTHVEVIDGCKRSYYVTTGIVELRVVERPD